MSPDPAAAPSQDPIAFDEDAQVFPARPRAQLNKHHVEVFEAQGDGRMPPHMLAFVCQPGLTPCITKSLSYAAMVNPHIARLVAAGPIPWGAGRRYCFLYEDTFSNPILSPEINKAGWKVDVVTNGIIKPMVSVFYDLQNTDMFHGAIRPTNMFGTLQDGTIDKFVLGEALCLPPGYDQPVLYETIERAMAQPGGRGKGTMRDDIYAFGVTLAVLLRHNDPMEGFSDTDIIRYKHEHGSYNALFGKESANGNHIDLIRGLLQDDPHMRWTITDIEGWLEGRRQSPKSGARKKKAGRPLVVNGEKYLYPEILAYDYERHGAENMRLLDNGEFEQWITRALEDPLTEVRVAKLKSAVEEAGQKETRDVRMLSCMSMALHPLAPIRFEGLKLMPMGFGTAFSETAMKKGNIRPYIDLIYSRLIVQWLEVQDLARSDLANMFSLFDACRNYLAQTVPGGGYERCLYFMDEDCPCLSEKIYHFQVFTPEDVLFAFENITASASKPVRLLDRHIIAFLLTRDRKNIEPYLMDINSESEHKRLLGELHTMATIQKRTRSGNTPHLSKWFADHKDLFLARIHDRDERARIAKEMSDAGGSGNLENLLNSVDNPRMKLKDMNGFTTAMREYQALEREESILKHELVSNPSFGRGTGRQVAAGLSTLIAFIIMALTVFSFLSSNGQGLF